MKTKFYIIISLTILLLFSCRSLISEVTIGKADIYKDLKILKKNNKTIFFLPMVHLGKEVYFNNCRILIDSLRKENFEIYYENVAYKDNIDSIEKMTYDYKVRSILGYNPRLSNQNKSLPKLYNKKNYILQDYNLMGLSSNDINLDLDKKSIIDSIESKYGKIKLSECDLNTKFDQDYKCKNDNDKYLFAFTNEFRDPYISNQVLKLKHNKIVLIYGKQHWYFIYPKLYKYGYKIVKGKI